MVNPAVEEVMVRIVKSRQHAGADDFDGLDKVSADDVVAAQAETSDDEALKKLSKKAFPAFGLGCRAGCSRFGRKRLRIRHLQVRVLHLRKD